LPCDSGSKMDLILGRSAARSLIAILARAQPGGRVLSYGPMGQVPLGKVLNPGGSIFEKGLPGPGWLKEMRGEAVPETEEYGHCADTYQARRPFQPPTLFSVF